MAEESKESIPKIVYFVIRDRRTGEKIREIEFRQVHRSPTLIALELDEDARIDHHFMSGEDIFEGIALIEYIDLLRDVMEGYKVFPRGYLFSKRRGYGDLDKSVFLRWLFFEIKESDLIGDRLVSYGKKTFFGEIPKDVSYLEIICMDEIPSPMKVLYYSIDHERVDLFKWILKQIRKIDEKDQLSLLSQIASIKEYKKFYEIIKGESWCDIGKMVERSIEFIKKIHYKRCYRKLFEKQLLYLLKLEGRESKLGRYLYKLIYLGF